MTTGHSLGGRVMPEQELLAGNADRMKSAMLGHFDLTRVALLLDIDGTLLDIAPTPQDIRVPATLLNTLGELRDRSGGALALISGRPLADIDRIFAPLKLSAIGGHGAESRVHESGEGAPRQADPLNEDLRERLVRAAKSKPGVLIEDKGYAIAFHYRLAPEVEHKLHEDMAAICAGPAGESISLLHGKSVIEIKSAHFNKGTAVRELMTFAPFTGRQPIFIGDDVTDEDVLAVLPEFGGIGLPVGRAMGGMPCAFDSPDDVRTWLSRILNESGARA